MPGWQGHKHIDYSALVIQCIVSTTVAITESISAAYKTGIWSCDLLMVLTQLHVEPADHQLKHNACTPEKGYFCPSHHGQHKSHGRKATERADA